MTGKPTKKSKALRGVVWGDLIPWNHKTAWKLPQLKSLKKWRAGSTLGARNIACVLIFPELSPPPNCFVEFELVNGSAIVVKLDLDAALIAEVLKGHANQGKGSSRGT